MVIQYLQCMCCGDIFPEDELEAPRSDSEPGCPCCGGTDLIEIENSNKGASDGTANNHKNS